MLLSANSQQWQEDIYKVSFTETVGIVWKQLDFLSTSLVSHFSSVLQLASSYCFSSFSQKRAR
jgi:hypothetical protein